MKIENCIALVTGANGGIGRQVVEALHARGARRIYAAMRDPAASRQALPRGIEVVRLDITDARSVASAAAQCADVSLLVNNAGVNSNDGFLAAPDLAGARAEIEVNYLGTAAMCRAFAPILAGHGGGQIANVLSITARIALPAMGSYCASKAAALHLTDCVRAELRAQGTAVLAFLPAAVDTAMTRGMAAVPKETPQAAAHALCEAIEQGADEAAFGSRAEYVMRMLRQDPAQLRREYAALLPKRPEVQAREAR